MKTANTPIVLQEAVHRQQQPDRDETRTTSMWLVDHKLPPLPVAPKQDPFKFPKKNKKGETEYETDGTTPKPLFTGKNPSFLDKDGKPHLLNHNGFQKRLPTQFEIEKWFANPVNGIGTLGGWHGIIWIDLDAKQFSNQAECDAAFNTLLENHPELRNTVLEQTHSGGYRVGVKTVERPTFTNFALSPGGKHVGEALGVGRFTVLAPTVGVSGIPYKSISRSDFVIVDSLESIGIHPHSAKKSSGKKKIEPVAKPLELPTVAPYSGSSVSLEQLLNEGAKAVLRGEFPPEGDRSNELTKLGNEARGWENWCDERGIPYSGSLSDLAHTAGCALGIEGERVDRIMNSIDSSTTPSAYFMGEDLPCWKKIRKLNKNLFDSKCPEDIKEEISQEIQNWRNKPTGKGFSADNLSTGVVESSDERDPNLVSTTSDDTILTALFDDGKGDWTVITDGYYQYQDEKGYWKYLADRAVERQIAQKLRQLYQHKKIGDGYQKQFKFATDRNKSSAFKFCRSALSEDTETLYNDHLLAFLNGTVDLRTGQLQEHDKKNLLTSGIASDYVKDAECPEVFKEFVYNAFGKEFLPLIRALTAFYLDPTAPYGYFAHIIGASGSGKGTLLRFWGSMFGEHNMRSLCSFSDISSAEGRHQYLTGARFISFPDMGGWQGSLKAFYELVDNGSLSGRALFSSSGYEKRWFCRFALASVDYLTVENSGDGWDRRCIPLPTKVRNGDIDTNLGKKLSDVRGEVISWALGMSRSERDNLIMNASQVHGKIASIKREQSIYSDSVKAFIDMALRPSDGRTAENHKLHDCYVAFCKAHGFQPMSATKFISHLKNVLPKNRADRRQYRKNGQVHDIPAHWVNLAPIESAFVSEQFGNQITWICRKSHCTEGGLDAFESFVSSAVTSVTDTPIEAGRVLVTAETQKQQELWEVSQPSQASQGKSLVAENFEKQLDIPPRPTQETGGENNNEKSGDLACDACDSASSPDTASVTGQLSIPYDTPVTPCDGCDGQQPQLKVGDEVEVMFFGSWCKATVLDCRFDGDFLVRAHIHLWDKKADFDAANLRLRG